MSSLQRAVARILIAAVFAGAGALVRCGPYRPERPPRNLPVANALLNIGAPCIEP